MKGHIPPQGAANLHGDGGSFAMKLSWHDGNTNVRVHLCTYAYEYDKKMGMQNDVIGEYNFNLIIV